MSVTTLTVTEFQVLGTVPVVPTLVTMLALGGFGGHRFSLPCRASLTGKKPIPNTALLPSMYIVLCSYAGLFWWWETYPANQVPFKIHVRHLFFCWHGSESHRKLWKEWSFQGQIYFVSFSACLKFNSDVSGARFVLKGSSLRKSCG